MSMLAAFLSASVLVLSLSAGACAGGAGSVLRSETTAGGLRLELLAGGAAYRPGDAVAVTLRITNVAAGPVAVTFGGQQFDVFVRQRGALIWQWSHDKAFAQVIRTRTLAPSEAISYSVTWDQRDLQGRQVDPGPYDLHGTFLGSQQSGPRSVEAGPVRITIGR